MTTVYCVINVTQHVTSLYQLVRTWTVHVKDWQETRHLFLRWQDDTRDIFLDGIVARNRALNGDIVVVQILPREQWKVDYIYLSMYIIIL